MNKSKNHNGFKLIAIVPLKDCAKKFRKNLTIGIPYLFYSNYKIELEPNKSTIKNVDKKETNIPSDLYNLKNGIKINVSAIVGENGSGKSALIEMFYYFIYAISSIETRNTLGLETDSKRQFRELKELRKDLKEFEDKCTNLGFRSSFVGNDELMAKIKIDLLHFINNIQNKHDIGIYLENSNSSYLKNFIEALEDKIKNAKYMYEESKKLDDLIYGKTESKEVGTLNIAVIYEIESDIFAFEFNKGSLTVKKNNLEIDDFDFSNFFYSISLNYSHHSLNSNTLGGWINRLFHKNDGYTAPLVINPMREYGGYDINHELNLSKERLMINLAYHLFKSNRKSKKYKLLNKYNVTSISFSIKSSYHSYDIGKEAEELKKLRSYFLVEDYLDNYKNINHLGYCIGYLEKKLEKILKNYHLIIFKNLDSSNEEKREECFQNFINEDKSHITKKVKRIINYIEYSKSNIGSSVFNIEKFEIKTINIQDFINYIEETSGVSKKSELSVIDLIDYLPPSIFDIDFKLNESILLSELSSGEQQMIFNINTILYHLYNIQSAHSTKVLNNRLIYKNVSIVLDEIELYYHPDIQRKFLKDLLDSLELVEGRKNSGIESINICFLTHSPFILSDIPSQNVLRLVKGEPKKNVVNNNSFASNIYDLLNDDFFLKNGAIGAFAQKYINDVIEEVDNLKGDSLDEDVEALRMKIEMIGEELIRYSLEELLIENIENKNTEITILEKRIRNLKA